MNYYDSSASKLMPDRFLESRSTFRNLKWKHVIISISGFMIISGIALVMLERTPAVFRTTVKLLVLSSDDYAAKPVPGRVSSFQHAAMDRDAYMSAESEILISDVVVDKTIAEIGPAFLYPDAGKPPGLLKTAVRTVSGFIAGFRLEDIDPSKQASLSAKISAMKSLRVDTGHSGNVIALSYENADPHMSALFVSKLIDNYFARRASFFADDQVIILAQQVGSKARELEQARDTLSSFQREYSISDFALQRQLLVNRLGDLTKTVQASEIEAAENRSRYDTVIAQLKAMPAASVRKVHGETITVRNGNVAADLQEDSNRLEQEMSAVSARVKGLRSEIASVQANLRELSEHEGKIGDLKLHVEALERQYSQSLQTLYERKSIEAVAQAWRSNVKLLDDVVTPTRPTSQRMLIAVSGLILALFSALSLLALCLFFAGRNQQKRNSDSAFTRFPKRVGVGTNANFVNET